MSLFSHALPAHDPRHSPPPPWRSPPVARPPPWRAAPRPPAPRSPCRPTRPAPAVRPPSAASETSPPSGSWLLEANGLDTAPHPVDALLVRLQESLHELLLASEPQRKPSNIHRCSAEIGRHRPDMVRFELFRARSSGAEHLLEFTAALKASAASICSSIS